MGVLKRKQENEAITFKLPAALKREIETLRGRAEDAGFDLGETITLAEPPHRRVSLRFR